MTSPEQLPTSAQTARRQLVRGVFAAPALLTVYSGSALAAGSAMRCLVNQTNTPVTKLVSDSTDLWLRVQLRQTGSSLPFSYWVRGADLQIRLGLRNRNTVYLSNSEWQPFNITNNTAGTKTTTAPIGDVESNPPKWAALRLDANGNVVGVGATGAGSALSGTCWHSVLPTL